MAPDRVPADTARSSSGARVSDADGDPRRFEYKKVRFLPTRKTRARRVTPPNSARARVTLGIRLMSPRPQPLPLFTVFPVPLSASVSITVSPSLTPRQRRHPPPTRRPWRVPTRATAASGASALDLPHQPPRPRQPLRTDRFGRHLRAPFFDRRRRRQARTRTPSAGRAWDPWRRDARATTAPYPRVRGCRRGCRRARHHPRHVQEFLHRARQFVGFGVVRRGREEELAEALDGEGRLVEGRGASARKSAASSAADASASLEDAARANAVSRVRTSATIAGRTSCQGYLRFARGGRERQRTGWPGKGGARLSFAGERATGEAGGGARGSEAHLTHPVFAISTCGERGGRRLAGA